jgi:hypothetical protein
MTLVLSYPNLFGIKGFVVVDDDDVEHKLECCDIEYIIRLIKFYKNIFKVYLQFYEKIIFCEV